MGLRKIDRPLTPPYPPLTSLPTPLPIQVWDYEKSTERKDSTGGTSKRSVLEQADKLEAWVNECQAATGAGASGSGASPGSGGGKKRKTK